MQNQIDEARKTIFTQLQLAWGNKSPIAWPNISFDPDQDAPKGTWIRPSIKFSDSAIGEPVINGSGYRKGVFWVNIFVPLNSGISYAFTLGSSLSSHFGMKVYDPVVFDMPTINDGGSQDKYYSVAFKIPFSVLICF